MKPFRKKNSFNYSTYSASAPSAFNHSDSKITKNKKTKYSYQVDFIYLH